MVSKQRSAKTSSGDADKRAIKISPGEGEMKIIELLAKFWGVSVAAIVLEAVRRSLDEFVQEYERGSRVLNIDAKAKSMRLEDLVLRLAAGETVTDDEISEVSGTMSTTTCGKEEIVEMLMKIRDLAKRRKGNGSPASV